MLHVAHFHRARKFKQPIRERGLTVIDVRDNTKVADIRRNLNAMRILRQALEHSVTGVHRSVRERGTNNHLQQK